MELQYICDRCGISLSIEVNEQKYQKHQKEYDQVHKDYNDAKEKYEQEMKEHKAKSFWKRLMSNKPIKPDSIFVKHPTHYFKPHKWERYNEEILCYSCFDNQIKKDRLRLEWQKEANRQQRELNEQRRHNEREYNMRVRERNRRYDERKW